VHLVVDGGAARGAAERSGGPPVRAARTWLASRGWQRLGLISLGEVPGDAPS
jgi:hypothetical protein